jgi:hypothetical protein
MEDSGVKDNKDRRGAEAVSNDNEIDMEKFRKKLEDKNQTYLVEYECMNCRKFTTLSFPKGKLVSEVGCECKHCGGSADQFQDYWANREKRRM